MRIAQVIGTITLNRHLPSFDGARLRLAVPFTGDELIRLDDPQGEAIVVWDELGAGIGSLIAIAEGPEASQPFRPELKPVDAYASAILDHVEIDPAWAVQTTPTKSK